jgi:hypothetical protein
MLRYVVLTLGLLSAASAGAACEYPSNVKVPDGASATEADIEQAGKDVRRYIADLEAYMACLDAEAAALPADQQTEETKSLHVKRHNAAVDAMEAKAAEFNDQLRAHKAANKK